MLELAFSRQQIGVYLGGFAWLVGTVFLLYLLLPEPMDGKGVNAQPAWDIFKILKFTANSWLREEARQRHRRQQATSDLWFRVREYDGIISYLLRLDHERTVRYIPIVHIHGLTESGGKAQLCRVLFELLHNQSMAEAAGPNSGDKPMPAWTGPISTGEYGYPPLCSQIKWEQTLTLFVAPLLWYVGFMTSQVFFWRGPERNLL